MAELWTRTPILQGDTEAKQLELIQSLCGGISPKVWPGVEQLPLYGKLKLHPENPRMLRDKLKPKANVSNFILSSHLIVFRIPVH
jgi:cyclin-dependent kinase 9